jgi:uncharacterized membrane protein
MNALSFLKLYGVGVVVCFGLDLVWLGLVAKQFYQKYIGHLMRPDIQWVPGVLFYVIYVAALIVFVVEPALQKQSLARAAGLGAFFGLAAYAAFDLTCLALFKDFPMTAAVVDLVWGASLSAVVCTTVYSAARYLI